MPVPTPGCPSQSRGCWVPVPILGTMGACPYPWVPVPIPGCPFPSWGHWVPIPITETLGSCPHGGDSRYPSHPWVPVQIMGMWGDCPYPWVPVPMARCPSPTLGAHPHHGDVGYLSPWWGWQVPGPIPEFLSPSQGAHPHLWVSVPISGCPSPSRGCWVPVPMVGMARACLQLGACPHGRRNSIKCVLL